MISKLIKLRDNSIKPKWFLRQAGRHIPEYYSIQNKHDNFIDCFDDLSIVDATILPWKYYNIDAAILFSDILLLPHLLGQKVIFKKKLGPVLKKININKEFLTREIDLNDCISIQKAILKIKQSLSSSKDLIGFCAP